MKALKKHIMTVAAFTAVFTLATTIIACSSDDDDDSGNNSSNVNLPASVGTNPFTGKIFSYSWSYSNDKGTATLKFTDSVLTITETSEDREGSYLTVDTYKYTYDTEKKLLHYGYISRRIKNDDYDMTISSINDYVAMAKKFSGDEWSSDIESYAKAEATAIIETTQTNSYTLTDTSLTLDKGYFSGTLPIREPCFNLDTNTYELNYVDCELSIKDRSGSSSIKYRAYPTFSDNTFSGKLYNKSDNYNIVGDIAGTYTATVAGTSENKITITFTKLPASLTALKTGTAYTLSQSGSGYSQTFTLEN